MGWNPDFKYKLLGKLIDTGNQMIFIFDLASPEIFISENADGKQGISRHASYPAEWQNQFGIPANDHQNSLQVSIFILPYIISKSLNMKRAASRTRLYEP